MSESGGHDPAKGQLRPGLTLVSTPLGNASDITLRALAALREADIILAEDTRTLRKLMDLHDIRLGGRPLLPFHDHSRTEERIMAAFKDGQRLVYLSDAGTPLISDPGFALVRMAHAEGVTVSATPGPCAAIMALTLSGLPTEHFFFAGFLPGKAAARQKVLAELAAIPATLIFYESPRRLGASLRDMQVVFGPREAAVARELTKHFEEVQRGSLSDLAARYANDVPKGEIVLLIGPPESVAPDPAEVDAALRAALTEMSVRDAASEVAARLGLGRKAVYARALELKGKG